MDQGLFSGSNFILNILLARWVGINEYGAFALGFTLYLFLSGFHNALILEPMSVFATSKYHKRLAVYFSNQVIIHFMTTSILGAFTLLVTSVLIHMNIGQRSIMQALLGVGVFLPVLLLMWLARRIYYVIGSPSDALLASFVYAVFLLGGAFLLSRSANKENLFLWFALLGGASLMGSLGLLSKRLKVLYRGNILDLRFFIGEQWLYGRWIVLSTIFYSAGTQLQIFIIASFLGIESAGAFRAVQNLMLPMSQILTAVATLSLPSVAFDFGRGDYDAMKTKSFRITIILFVIAVFYEVTLLLGANWIEYFLYEGKYAQFRWLIPLIGLVPLVSALETGYSLILRSIQKPMFYIIDKALAAVTGGISAFVLIFYWKVSGAVFSLVLIELVALTTYWLLYRRWFLNLK